MPIRVVVTDNYARALATVDTARTKAVSDAVTHIESRSQSTVPVDTGTLRSSVEKRLESGPGTTKGEVSYNTDYAIYVEMGTANMAAQPYLRPSYDTGKKVVVRELITWLRGL